MARRKWSIEKLYLDFSNESADEAVFKFPADAVSSAGTLSHQVPVDVGGTVYYLYLYTHGS